MKRTAFKVLKAAMEAKISDPGFKIDNTTAFVMVDPQNDFLQPDGDIKVS